MSVKLPSLEEIERVLCEDPGRPALLAREIADALRLPASARARLRRNLQRYVSEGLLVSVRGRRFGAPCVVGSVVGRFHRHPQGFGFVIPDEAGVADIFVPPGLQVDALHGDIVAAVVEEVREDGKRQGRILRVVERRSSEVVGTFMGTYSGGGVVEPVEAAYGFDIVIGKELSLGAESGEMVRVVLESYPSQDISARGRVVERLGRLSEPGVDIEVLIRKYGLAAEFPDEVLAEAESLPRDPDSWPLGDRTNFTTSTVVTIDGKTAKDFDDGICVERSASGGFMLHVHIADVSFFVREGSLLDMEALRRGTSTYFPGRVLPMLPERLSNDLCSLRPDELRLTQGVSLEYDERGVQVGAAFHRGYIRSSARLTYEEVHAIVDERVPALMRLHAPVVDMLENASALARLLIARRAERGAVDIDLPEVVLKLDRRGRTTDIVGRSRVHSHRMIEEFMIAANEAVGRRLRRKRLATLYRVHERPDPERISRMIEALEGLGYGGVRLGATAKPRDYAELVHLAAGQPEETLVQRLILRSMALARYDPECLGHFGLALDRYLHFTSPIRRYPDLVVHRTLGRMLGANPESPTEKSERLARLPELAVECSRLERLAEGAEREAVAWKCAAFMADKVGDVFRGRVVEVASHGLTVALSSPFVEGLVSVSQLGKDYFRFDSRRRRLIGRDTGQVFRLGQELDIRLDRVDVLAHQIDFTLVGATSDLGKRMRSKHGRGIRRSKGQQRPKPSSKRRGRRGRH